LSKGTVLLQGINVPKLHIKYFVKFQCLRPTSATIGLKSGMGLDTILHPSLQCVTLVGEEHQHYT